jgi:exonuclease SbcC
MKLLSIEIENFKPFSRLELPNKTSNVSELPNGLYTIKGRNSSGKSSLIEAILWGLWGSKRDCGVIDESKDRLIKRDASKCRVQMDFKVGDTKYRIKREKTRGKPTIATIAKYTQNNQLENPISGSREVCKKLESIMNCAGKQLDSTFFVRQGEIDYLANISGSELRNKIQELFQLDQFDLIKEELKEMREEHINLQQELISEKGRIEGKMELLPELKKDIEKLNEDKLNLEQVIQQLDDKLAEYPTIEDIQKIETLNERITNASNQVESYTKEISILDDILKDDFNELEKEKSDLSKDDKEFQTLEKKIKSLPSLESVTALINLISNRANFLEQIKSLDDEFIKCSSDFEFPKTFEQRVDYEKTQRKKLQDNEETTEQSLKEIEQEIKDLLGTINTKRGIISSLKSNIEVLKEKGDCPTCYTPFHEEEELDKVIQRIENNILNYNNEINQLEKYEHEKETSIGVIKENLENIKQDLLKLENISQCLTRTQEINTRLSNLESEISLLLKSFEVSSYEELFNKYDISDISELSESIGRIKNEFNSKKERLKEFETEISRLELKIQEKENRIQKLIQEKETIVNEKLKNEKQKQGLLNKLGINTINVMLERFNVSKLHDIVTAIQVLFQEKKEKLSQYNSLQNDINEGNIRLNKLLDEINKLDDIEKQIRQEESTIKHHDVLIKPYLEQFISQEVIQNKLFKSLRSVVSKYLQQFTYGQYKMNEIVITKHGKTHGVSITLTDLIDGLEKDKDMLSGGDKAALGLALRMGISELMGHIRPFRSSGLHPIYFKTIILDEPLGSLDTARREGVLAALMNNKAFNQIFLITHTQTNEGPSHSINVIRSRDTSIAELRFATEVE